MRSVTSAKYEIVTPRCKKSKAWGNLDRIYPLQRGERADTIMAHTDSAVDPAQLPQTITGIPVPSVGDPVTPVKTSQ